MKATKRIIAIVLTLVVCMSTLLLPISALQFEHDHNHDTQETGTDVPSTTTAPQGYVPKNEYIEHDHPVTYAAGDGELPRVLLVEDVLPWDSRANQTVLSKITQFDKVSTSQFLKVDLSKYGVIVFANDQPFNSYSNYTAFKEYMELFASLGGVIVFGACDSGWANGTLTEKLPGDVTKKTHYVVKNYIADATHPIVSCSLSDYNAVLNSDLTGSYCSHVSFDESSLPAGTKIILRESNTNRPTLIEYPLGKGRVIASGLTWEFTYDRGGDNGAYGFIGYYAQKAMDDMFRYAIRVSSIDVDDVHVLEEYYLDLNAHHIIVSDQQSNAIENATITINGVEYRTNENGALVYRDDYGVKTVTVSAQGYQTTTLCYDLQPTQFKLVFLNEDAEDGRPYVTMVSDTNSLFDLRYQTKRYTEASTTKISLKVTADWMGHTPGQYVIYQEGYQKTITSADGTFDFAPGQVLAPNVPVKLKLISKDGTSSTPIDIQLAVDPKREDAFNNESAFADMQIGTNQGGSVGDPTVSLVFPGDFKLEFPALPFEANRVVHEDGSYEDQVLIGIIDFNLKDKKAEWATIKNKVKSWVDKGVAADKALDQILKSYGGKKWAGTALIEKKLFNPEIKVVGYYEEKFDAYGNLIERDGGVIISGGNSSVYTRQFLAGPVPIYLDLSGEIKLNIRLGVGYNHEDDKWLFDGKLDIEGSITLGGGLGVSGLASVGVEGKGQLDIGLLPDQTGDITLSASLRARLLWVFDWRLTIAKKRYHLWGPDPYAAYLSGGYDYEYTMDIASRDYNELTSEWYGENVNYFDLMDHPESVRTLQEYILPTSMPELVEVNGQYILFFHTDYAERDVGNNIVLMYSVYDDATDTWAAPLPVALSDSSDLYAEMIVVDDELYVVWQKIDQALVSRDINELLDEMTANIEVSFAKWNPSTQSFEQAYITDDAALDMYPQLAMDDDQMSIVWISNDENNATGESGIYTVYTSHYENGGWSAAQPIYQTSDYISELAAGYINDELHVLYIDGTVLEGGNVHQIINGTSLLVANQTDLGSSLYFNQDTFAWNAAGDVYCYSGSGEYSIIRTGDMPAILSSFRMLSNGVDNTIVWLANDSNGLSVIYASVELENGWSNPIAIYESYETIQYFDATFEDDGSWSIVFTSTSDPDAQDVSLMYANIQPRRDITLNLVDIDETKRENGMQPIYVNVTNNGQTTLTETVIQIVDEYGNLVCFTTLPCNIPVGQSAILETVVDLSHITEYTELEVTVYAQDEADWSDNTDTVAVGYVNVILDIQQYTVGNQIILSATVQNLSDIPADVAISIIQDSRDGIVLDMKNIGVLTKDTNYVYIYSIDRSKIDFEGLDHKYYYIVIDTLQKDWTEYDNYQIISMHPVEIPEGHVHFNGDGVYVQTQEGHYKVCDDCGEIYDQVAHTESDWLPGKAPTCTEEGYSTWKCCVVCGYVLAAQDTLPPTDHTPLTVGEKEAQCGVPGYSGDIICSTCLTILSEGHIIYGDDHITETIGAAPATCEQDGYTGDVVCLNCHVTLKQGEIIPKTKHKPLTLNYKYPSCTSEGYTGDIVCSVCDAMLLPGSILPTLPHTEKLVGEKPASCCDPGYTGDIICEKCETVLVPGEVIESPEHPSTLINQKDPTCTQVGYTGDLYCEICQVIASYGQEIPVLDHTPCVVGEREATCITNGYTGDTLCADCGEILSTGSETELLPHTPQLINVTEATCVTEGYTGDIICEECQVLMASGRTIPTIDHTQQLVGEQSATCTQEGYTGDIVCEECSTVLHQGTTLPRLPHTTYIVGASEASCAKEGYTGDVICSECNNMIEQGTTIDKLPHFTKLLNQKAPSCTEEGYTGDYICSVCNETVTKGNAIGKLDHKLITINQKKASCSEEGYTGDSYCTACKSVVSEGTAISKEPHTPKLENQKAPTCAEEGYTGDEYCTVCHELIHRGTSIDTVAHTLTTINQKDATCTEEGYTGDSYCSACDNIVSKGNATEKAEHTLTTINQKDATCTEEGYTGDSYCAACKSVVSEGSAISKEPHTPKLENQKAPTCAEEGYTGDEYCTVCHELIHRGTSIDTVAHTLTTINQKDATCTEEGYTGDSYCSACDNIVSKGNATEKAEHTLTTINQKDATCSEEGYTGDSYCTVCNNTIAYGEATKTAPHTAILVREQPATCQQEGYTGDSICLNCGVTIIEGESIEKLPHAEQLVGKVEAVEYEQGYTGDVVCSVCGQELQKGSVIPAPETPQKATRWVILAVIGGSGVLAGAAAIFIIPKLRRRGF